MVDIGITIHFEPQSRTKADIGRTGELSKTAPDCLCLLVFTTFVTNSFRRVFGSSAAGGSRTVEGGV